MRLLQSAVTFSVRQFIGCARKLAYRSRKSAEDAGKRQRKYRNAPALKTYQCRYCEMWHFTKDRR